MKKTIICWLLAWAMGFMCACLLLGCGGEIDPAGSVRAERASDTWIIERRHHP